MSTDKAVAPPLPEAVRALQRIVPADLEAEETWLRNAEYVRLDDVLALVEVAAQQERVIDCPLCGTTVKQVASATLSLALWQHVNWVCQSAQQERASVPTRPKVISDLLAVDHTGTVANYIRHLEKRAHRLASALNQVFTILRDLDSPLDVRVNMAYDVAEAALRASHPPRTPEDR